MRHALRCQDVWKRVSIRDARGAIVIERSVRTPLTECAPDLRGADVCRADHRRTRISMTELLAGTRSVVILLKMFPNRIDMEAFVQLQSRADARRPQVAAVPAPVGYRIAILAFAVRPRAYRAHGHPVALQGHVPHDPAT